MPTQSPPSARQLSAAQILRKLGFLQQRVEDLSESVRLFCNHCPTQDRYTLHQVWLIQTEVAESLGVNPASLLNHCRRADLVWARHLAIHLSHHLLGLNLSALAPLFHRDHTSIHHALRCVQNTIATDARRRAEVQNMEHRVKVVLMQADHSPSHD